MGFMIPCCICGAMLTSRAQKGAFKLTRQIKFNHEGKITLDKELDFERPVCGGCVSRMEGEGHIFNPSTGVVVKHYAEDGKSALVPTPDIPIPAREKEVIKTTPDVPRKGFKDVQIAYMLDGIAGVDELVNTKQVSKSAVKRALKKFKGSGRDVTALEKWVLDNVGTLGKGRGAPRKGEVRTYRSQQIQKGGPFARIPLDTMDLPKGSVFRVSFEDDRIVIFK